MYIPLGGNRNGMYKKIKNVLIVFILSGLWHGASANFLYWGLLHGILYLLAEYITIPVSSFLKVFLTFILINLTWIFFRSNNFNESILIFNKIFNFSDYINLQFKKYIVFGFLFIVSEIVFLNYNKLNIYIKYAYSYVLLFFVAKYSILSGQTFIYFQF